MTTADARRFEHFRRPSTVGMGGLGKYGTFTAFGIAVAAVVANVFLGLVYGIIIGAVGGISLMAVATKDRHGRSVLDRAASRAAHLRARHSGSTEYRSGPLSQLGKHTLPGVLAQTELSEATDTDGEPFAMVYTPATNQFSVTIEAFPDDSTLVDPDVTAATVDRWGEWLSALADEPGCEQVMVTLEDGPDDGHALRRELHDHATEHPPLLAQRVADAIGETYPPASSKSRSFVTLTFSGASGSGKRSKEEMGEALATRLPELIGKLSGAGGGFCATMDAQSVTETIKVAYDPDTAKLIGASDFPLMMRWDSIGPPAADLSWTEYRHGSAVSRTWTMTGILGSVHTETLAPLLRPHPRIARKRVSLIYQFQDPASAPRIAGHDVDVAQYAASGRKVTGRQRKDLKAAEVIEDSEAHGNALIDVGLTVTVTVPTMEELPAADAVIDALGSARPLLVREDGAHAAAFAAGLPCIGLMSSRHSYVPRKLRAAL